MEKLQGPEVIDAMLSHIEAVAGHWKDDCYSWCVHLLSFIVRRPLTQGQGCCESLFLPETPTSHHYVCQVNEPFNDDEKATFRNSTFYNVMGADYIEIALLKVRSVAPKFKLYLVITARDRNLSLSNRIQE